MSQPKNPDQIQDRLNKLAIQTSAKVRHFIEKSKTVKPINTQNHSFKEARKTFTYLSNGALDFKKDIIQKTKISKQLIDNTKYGKRILKLSQNKFIRSSAIGLGIFVGLSMLNKTISNFSSQKVIPEKYEKGYDLIEKSFTDFGSPVKLNKVSSKVINNYYSSIRKNRVTTTNTIINSNPVIYMNNNAINHYKY